MLPTKLCFEKYSKKKKKKKKTVKGKSPCLFNWPLTPMSDQDKNFVKNTIIMSSRKNTRIKKNIH